MAKAKLAKHLVKYLKDYSSADQVTKGQAVQQRLQQQIKYVRDQGGDPSSLVKQYNENVNRLKAYRWARDNPQGVLDLQQVKNLDKRIEAAKNPKAKKKLIDDRAELIGRPKVHSTKPGDIDQKRLLRKTDALEQRLADLEDQLQFYKDSELEPPAGLIHNLKKTKDELKSTQFELDNPYHEPLPPGGINDTPKKLKAAAPVAAVPALDEIRENYGLDNEALFNQYFGESGQPSTYTAPRTRPMTHETGASSDANLQAAKDYTDELKFAARWGPAQIPGDVAWMGSLVADQLPGADYYAAATGQPLSTKLNDVANNAYAYWTGKADTQGDNAARSPEGLLPNLVGLGTNMMGEGVVLGAPFKIGKAVDRGIDALQGGYRAARVNPGPVDESRRTFIQAAPTAAAATGIGGLAGLKAITKGAPEAAAKADDIAEYGSKLLDYNTWEKAGKPKGQIPDYIRREDNTPLNTSGHPGSMFNRLREYNNYLRAMHKDIKKGFSESEIRKITELTDSELDELDWLLELKSQGLADKRQLDRLSKYYEIHSPLKPEPIQDLIKTTKARKNHKLRMDDYEYRLSNEFYEKTKLPINRGMHITGPSGRDPESLEYLFHPKMGSTPEQFYAETKWNNPNTKLRIKDLAKQMEHKPKNLKFKTPDEIWDINYQDMKNKSGLSKAEADLIFGSKKPK